MSAVRFAIPDALASMRSTGRYVIEASAGTGKTFLIEHRVLQLVARGASIDSILVVTFTEKATAELRRRIRALLAKARSQHEHSAAEDEAHIPITDAVRRRLQDALHAADTAPIFTIHGFCQRVLTDDAFSSRRLFEQTHVAARTAFGGAFRAALREVFSTDARFLPYLRAYLASGQPVAALEELLFAIDQQPGELRPAFDAAAAAAGAEALLDAARAAGGADGVLTLCAEAKVHASTRKAIARRVAELEDSLAAADSALEVCAALDREACKSLDTLRDKLPTGRHALLDALRDAAERLRGARCPVEAAVAHALLPEVQRRVRRDKASRGELDFGDLLELVWESLRGEHGDALAARLRRRYRHALIDEFQDTDPTQWKIFERLFVESDEAASFAIIGDPKQAIYGFRGADVATYLRACDEVARRGGATLRLPNNYRSTPAIVAAYNRLVTTDEMGPFFSGGIRYDEPVIAARGHRARRGGAAAAPCRVLRLVPPADETPRAAAVRASLAGRIAAEIQDLLGDRPLFIEDEDGEARRIEARDIFVLTRSRSESDEIADALRRAGVPCALYQQAGLFASTEATEVFELLLGIAEPQRQAARFRAWQTPFFDVPLDELTALAAAGDDHPLVTTLFDWHALAAEHRYDELFSAILTESGIVERELFCASSERSITNLLHIFELLLAEVNRSRCSILELAQRLGSWQREAEAGASADADLQRLESDASAVQIMTIHKSKGLEAGVVFLYGACGAQPPAKGSVSVYREDGRRIVHVGPADGPVAAAIAEEAAAEDQRLLYVALTRAVARLYVPLYPESKGTYAQLNDRLARIVERAGDPAIAAEFEIEDVAIGIDPDDELAAGDPDPLAGWQPPAELLEPPRRDPAVVDPARRGFAMTSYSRLKRAEAGARAAVELTAQRDEVTLAHNTALERAADELPPGAASGTFLHEVLEHLDVETVRAAPDFEAWRHADDVRRLFDRAIARHGTDPRHRCHSEEMVYGALTTPVRPLEMPRLADRERDARELEFLFPIPGPIPGQDRERGFVRGFIDYVFVWRGRSYVLDWKSDLLADYGARAIGEHVAAHYTLQAELYAIALVKMLGIRDGRDFEQRFGGVVYWFLRGAAADGSGIYAARPGFDELRRAEATLATVEIE